MTPEQRQQITGTVECRMSGEVYAVPVLFALIGLMMWFVPPKTASDQFVIRVIAAQIFGLSVFFGLYLRRYYVRADDRGLTWHIPFRKGSCAWHEITDYYYLPAPQNKSARVIEFGSEKVMLGKSAWTQGEVLEAMIQQRTAGRLGYDWAVRGSRDTEKFPLSFRYNANNSKAAAAMALLLGSGMTAFIVSQLWSGIPRNAAVIGWSLTLAMSAMYLLVMGFPIAMAWLMWQIARDGMRRHDESLTVDKEGITFEKGTQYTHIAWQEVTSLGKGSLSLLRTHTRITTARAEIVFSSNIEQVAVLRAVLNRYLPQSILAAAAAHDEDNLAPSANISPDGSTVYHYRTRPARALLWMPFLFALTVPLTLVLRHYDLVPQGKDGDAFMGCMALLLLFVTLYGYWRYRVGGIRTTREGIYQKTLRGERFLSWAAVEDFCTDGVIFHIVGNGTHLRFNEAISRLSALFEEIAANAHNCNGQKWERRSPRKSSTKPIV